ncbi:hypothetical protein B0H16DRAFT_1902959 [Mycena metata]|uniref:BHLH domain-containing protein n=1 Tax=Mycena metata TaxID=1033252 RepID=A0AAD7GLP4_9AGAR|nr:hypothetical protein B0H16DRAFT_1902959 [Mycena metata]
MNDDLGLDLSDPLNLLLHNHSQHNMQASDHDSSPSFTTMDLGMDTTDFGLFNLFQFTFEAPSPLPSSESESGGSTASVDTGCSVSSLANRVCEPSYPPPNPAASAFTTVPIAPSAPPTLATPVQTATQLRPKTSHTTIEHRYRTNLNARIQLLRKVVPALRVRGIVDSGRDQGGRAVSGKKAKVEPAPKVKVEHRPAAPVQEGEKKKCGRPRKVVPLPVSVSTNSSHVGSPALSTSMPMHSSTAAYAQWQQEIMHQQQDLTGAPRRYILRAFALFSFFTNANVLSPSPSSYSQSTPHAHEGHVLAPVGMGIAGKVYGLEGGGVGGMGLLQAFHLLASTAVLVTGGVGAEEGSETEMDGERSAGSGGSLSEEDVDAEADASEEVQAQAHHEAEACMLDDSTPLRTRLRTVFRLYTSAPPSTSSTSASTTPRSSARARSSTETADDGQRLLALLVRPVPLLGARVAPQLWAGVDDAAGRLGPTKPKANAKGGVLRTLEAGAAVERLRAVRRRAFVREVLGTPSTASYSTTSTASSSTASTPTSAGDTDTDASTDTLAKAASSERKGGSSSSSLSPDDDVLGGLDDLYEEESGEQEQEGGGAEADVEKLLRAIMHYRRVFDSASSASASASPASANTKGGNANARTSEAVRALRRTLGSSEVFEGAGGGRGAGSDGGFVDGGGLGVAWVCRREDISQSFAFLIALLYIDMVKL